MKASHILLLVAATYVNGAPVPAIGEFIGGAVDSVVGTVQGIGQILTDPVGTVKGVAKAVLNPLDTADALGKSIEKTYKEKGGFYVAGHAAADLATFLVPVGASTGTISKSSGVGKFAAESSKYADDLAKVAAQSDEAAKIAAASAQHGDDLARLAAQSSDDVARLQPNDIAALTANGVTDAEILAATTSKQVAELAQKAQLANSAAVNTVLKSTAGLSDDFIKGLDGAQRASLLDEAAKVDAANLAMKQSMQPKGVEVVQSMEKYNDLMKAKPKGAALTEANLVKNKARAAMVEGRAAEVASMKSYITAQETLIKNSKEIAEASMKSTDAATKAAAKAQLGQIAVTEAATKKLAEALPKLEQSSKAAVEASQKAASSADDLAKLSAGDAGFAAAEKAFKADADKLRAAMRAHESLLASAKRAPYWQTVKSAVGSTAGNAWAGAKEIVKNPGLSWSSFRESMSNAPGAIKNGFTNTPVTAAGVTTGLVGTAQLANAGRNAGSDQLQWDWNWNLDLNPSQAGGTTQTVVQEIFK